MGLTSIAVGYSTFDGLAGRDPGRVKIEGEAIHVRPLQHGAHGSADPAITSDQNVVGQVRDRATTPVH